jgi:hypothetical protein
VTNNLDDDSAGTLRSRIQNDAQEGDTIVFDIQGQTITLVATKGPLNLRTNNVTIDGTTQGDSISGGNDPNNATQLLVIGSATNQVNATVKNLSFTNGNSAAPGAAIEANGSLTLTNDVFNNNTDSNAAGFGGGAVAWWGRATDVLTVTNCQFLSNTATGAGSKGGAIEAISGASIVLDHDAFTSNSADNSGGAVYAISGGGDLATVTVRNGCTFDNNQVIGTGGRFAHAGGAIYTDELLVTTGNGIRFQGNSAPDFGGAIWYQASKGSSLTLTNITFRNNQAANGGAVADSVFPDAGTVRASITGCLFDTNHASGGARNNYGGALYISHDPTAAGSASLSVTNSTFYNNSAYDGGAIALNNGTPGSGFNTVTLTSLTISDNKASYQGGGLWIEMTGP